jgi:hypothetical protein
MSFRWSLGMAVLGGAIVLSFAPAASAVQEPGDQYIFILDEPNSYIKIDFLGFGAYIDQSRLGGWMTAYLGTPAPGSPKAWNVKAVLGTCNMYNTESLDLSIPFPIAQIHIYQNNLRIRDMDIWYQDPNDWWQDPNDWPGDPNKIPTPANAPNPNSIVHVNPATGKDDPAYGYSTDPNDPNYNDPNIPTILRWANLTGGPAISTGQLNSEVLYFARTYVQLQGSPDSDSSSFGWSKPFGPWSVQVADTPLLFNRSGMPSGPVQIKIEWKFWTKGSISILGTVHIEAVGGLARNLNMSYKHDNWGTVTMNPAPVDPNRVGLKFPDMTNLTLTATPTVDKKVFDKWTIFDPNYPADPNHGTIDTNSVTHLVMDKDQSVEAAFKCASSGLEPFVAMTLLMLSVGVVVRRMS